MNALHLKYFDDVSFLKGINLRKSLKKDNRMLQKPLNFHNRSGHQIEVSKFLTLVKLQDVKNYAKESERVINLSKTKIMLFNKSSKHDFMPEIDIFSGEMLEDVEEFKVLGLIFFTDLRWNKHVKYICKRGYSQLWFLRRLKKLGASAKILIDIYEKHIGSILEYAVPAWGPMITVGNGLDLERVQKVAYCIIFWSKFL